MDFITDILSLKKLKKPVNRLYYKGNLELLNFPKVAIVGSRKCTSYTKNLVLNLASTLKNYGICVVSGAAIGADIHAHEGAFPNTIAVFGNGLDNIYPAQNSKMIEKIYKDALALSEYEPNALATPWSFLERNRIVVALSDAVIIAEADMKSGSMSSARLALDMGIPLFVLPQRLNESNGTNDLLSKNRANLISDFDEFASKFGSLNSDLSKDDVLEFIKTNQNFDECYARFGDALYEYELDGKISIDGVYVRLLS
ncbi:DNA-processing protein DprA [Campylobacter fetus]|uniref:DNA-processing protein DprA n=1 Tax=Campylobacter fetus TaxID=196 RepID=UPI00057ED1B6|nr:DNA-processing protein DprA [Campylobacter fetus]AJB45698.1 DNA processing protein DprA [Campylobacter fetus subsp. testudinum]ALV65128.1 DNA protecting protein DprA [Campylobacter fetus subsp. testudinum Sp3]AVK81398.1 DNA-processing protein DprA [Campylobacter fetus subsp. testudinum]EAK0826384.1 DNA-processing protein DprA [Campylobacter fetus]EAK0829628.1 DNA-processing protein DprA [Campylobacter fetus]